MQQTSHHTNKSLKDIKSIENVHSRAQKKTVLSADHNLKKRSFTVKKGGKGEHTSGDPKGDYQPDVDRKKYKIVKTEDVQEAKLPRNTTVFSHKQEKEHSGVSRRTSKSLLTVAKEECTGEEKVKKKGNLVADFAKNEKRNKYENIKKCDGTTSASQVHQEIIKNDTKCNLPNFTSGSKDHKNISEIDKNIVQQEEITLKDTIVSCKSKDQTNNIQQHDLNGVVQPVNLSEYSQPEIADEYADDFNDYASDFDDVSTEEEKIGKVDICTSLLSSRHSSANDKPFTKPCQSRKGTSSTVFSSNIEEWHKNAYRDSTTCSISVRSNVIDFTRSLRDKETAVRKRIKCRSVDLLRLIDLDLDGCSHLFELKPLDEYVNYMLRFGKAGHNQRQVQTQEDAVDREAQTELILMSSGGVWTQIPPMDTGECCGTGDYRNLSDTSGSVSAKDTVISEIMDDFCFSASISDRLALSSTACTTSDGVALADLTQTSIPDALLPQLRTVLCLLEEDALPRLLAEIYDDVNELRQVVEDEVGCSSSRGLGSGCDHPRTTLALPKPSTFGDSGCVACVFAHFNKDRLLTLHRSSQVAPTEGPGESGEVLLRQPGEFIYIWSICGGSGSPLHQLYAPGLLESSSRGDCIACAVFSPDIGASFVIGGLVDGSLCVWDLRCNERNTVSPQRRDQTASVLQDDALPPAYCTVGMAYKSMGKDFSAPTTVASRGTQPNGADRVYQHIAPIADLQLVLESSTLVSFNQLQSDGRNFHFAAIDSMGELTLWLAISQSGLKVQSLFDVGSGSHSDLGLRPGGRVRLIQMMHLSAQVRTHFHPPHGGMLVDSLPSADRVDTRRASNSTTVTVLTASPRNTFLVGFTDGSLIQMPRSASQQVYPRQFNRPQNRASLFTVAVHPDRTIDLMLAGYADGAIRLFSTQNPAPLDTFQATHQTVCRMGRPLKLLWSQTLPFVFFCLHSTGCTTGWRLTPTLRQEHIRQSAACREGSRNSRKPCHQLATPLTSERSAIFDMALSQSVPVSLKGETRLVAALALVFSDSVKIHWLDPAWVQPDPDEPDDRELFFSELLTFSPDQAGRLTSPHCSANTLSVC